MTPGLPWHPAVTGESRASVDSSSYAMQRVAVGYGVAKMTDQPVEATVAPSLREAGKAAMIGRLATIGVGLVSAALLPIALDPASVGLFFLATSVAAGLGTVCQMGLTAVGPALVTDAIARSDLGGARHVLVTMVLLCTGTGGLLVLLSGALARLVLDHGGASDTSLWRVLTLVSVFAMASGLTVAVSELLRATHAVRSAAALTAAASAPAALYALWALLLSKSATVHGVLTACAGGAALCAGAGLVILWRRTSSWRSVGDFSEPGLAAIVRRAVPVMLTTLLLFLLASADLWILAAIGAYGEVAHYGLALRCATLVLLPLGIVNSAAAPLVVHARATRDEAELSAVVDGVVRTGAGAALVLYVVFALTGYWLILAWNPAYVNVYGLVLILGAGSVLHSLGGAAGVLLMVWGDQRGALMLTVVAGVAQLALCVLGYMTYGVFGLAVGTAVGNAVQPALFVLRVRARFEIDPSVLRLRGGRWRHAS
jgi:O-antigen/teichoic acid export membrane protein